ncbi:G2/M phase-specific E3 ubiquitin-protein ligase [Melanotaenia boesemani]|uniref:G2/M phase-specific E3 ubiquitin-protein ligase n=1 Tax=Melanotaenia boesemani TaxID=1250792 RepID=UPI001C04611A|nr:G2/M phase-specific E3 ubiquitin-protein ligase [Melanotaenia boesemani]
MVNVCSSAILEGALRAFHRRTFSPEARLSLVFLDDSMQAEGAVDEGGPSREFFRLLLRAIKDSTLFTGPESSKNLSLDSHALQRGLYKTFGTMIAVAFVHGGVAPLFFSERLYNSLCQLTMQPPTLDEVTDGDLREKLKKISEAANLMEARAAVEEAAESLSLLGSLRHIVSMEGRDQLVEAATSFYVEGRIKEPLEQFAMGLSTLGVLGVMRSHPTLMRDVFAKSNEALQAATLMHLFGVQGSCQGSNRWHAERRTEGFWRDYLLDIEDGAMEVTLEQVLVFVSGADRIPVLGFTPRPTLSFLHEHGKIFPEANTCIVNLKLPIHQNYENFCKYMSEGIIQSPTFGMA